MKKQLKIWNILLFLSIFLLLTFSLISCNFEEPLSIESTEINDAGELIIRYSDGSEKNLGLVVGKDGKDGINGKNGIDGENGKDGKDGADGKDGKDGIDGKDGKDGIDGENSSTIIIDGPDGFSAPISKSLRSSVIIQASYARPTGTVYAKGAGVIYEIDEDENFAYIITNFHVLYDTLSVGRELSQNVRVYLYGSENSESAITATYVGGSMDYDLAILRVNAEEITAGGFAEAATISTETLYPGDTVIAIGFPSGSRASATVGVVSVESEKVKMLSADEKRVLYQRFMRIDTPVSPGNSGGGLYSTDGDLVGIVTGKKIEDGYENIGYATPLSIVRGVADKIIDTCDGAENTSFLAFNLGVQLESKNSRAIYDAEAEKITITEEVIIDSVESSSKFSDLLSADDRILTVSVGEKSSTVTRLHHIEDTLLNVRLGDTVTLTLMRGEETKTVTIEVTSDMLTAQ